MAHRMGAAWIGLEPIASIVQLVERDLCNVDVFGSIPDSGSIFMLTTVNCQCSSVAQLVRANG